jgi:hypothetical protein
MLARKSDSGPATPGGNAKLPANDPIDNALAMPAAADVAAEVALEQFSTWIDEQLQVLEDRFDSFRTRASLRTYLRHGRESYGQSLKASRPM